MSCQMLGVSDYPLSAWGDIEDVQELTIKLIKSRLTQLLNSLN